jgi:cobalt-zinc-cadmium efflux system outer membrane protein
MQRIRRASPLCLLGLWPLVLGRWAEASDTIPSSLSLAQAEELFLQRGLDLLIAEYGAQGAEGDLRAAGAHPNPGLSLDGLYGPQTSKDLLNGGLGGNSTATNFGLSVGLSDNAALEDQLSGKRSLRIEASAKALLSARINVDDIKRTELSQLRQAYVAAVMAKLNVDATNDAFATYDKQLQLNQRRYDEGAINGLDLSRVLQAQLEARQAQDQAQAGLRQALASLLFLLGARDAVPALSLTTAIAFAPLDRLNDATIPSLLELALKHRTDVKMATANLEQTQVLLRQAKRQRLPDIAVNLGYSEQCNNQTCSSAPSFQAGLSGNLPVLYQQQGEIQRSESNVHAAERTLDKAKAQVLSDVAQALAGYVAATHQVQRMEGQLLKQAKLSRDLAQAMYQKGAASFIDFMDAQRTYVASLLEYNQDLANYWSAVYQLEQATAVTLR